MANRFFYMVSITVQQPVLMSFVESVSTAKLDTAASAVGDWIRLNSSTWIVWSELSTQQISQTFVALFDNQTAKPNIIVMGLNPVGAQGLAPEWIWNWINSKILPPAGLGGGLLGGPFGRGPL